MKLLISSPAFLPQVGGLEYNVAHLAEALAARGHRVVVATRTPGATPAAPYRVARRPGPLALLRLARWCDVFLQANVSLRGLWPLVLVRRPWVVSHHSWYCRSDGRVAWADRLKRRLVRRAAASIAVSQAVADDLDADSIVIPNAYRDELFRLLPGVERRGELVFVGRLVSDKGVDLLLAALGLLAGRGLRPRLTVVGDGPEAPRLRAQAERLGVAGEVEFAGTRTGEALVELLNRHRVLVVPSRYNEPFGIVALEGIACGCAVVGSSGGGLGQAIGPCGLTFPNGDVARLADCLVEALRPDRRRDFQEHARAHLDRHSTRHVIDRYERVLASVVPS